MMTPKQIKLCQALMEENITMQEYGQFVSDVTPGDVSSMFYAMRESGYSVKGLDGKTLKVTKVTDLYDYKTKTRKWQRNV